MQRWNEHPGQIPGDDLASPLSLGIQIAQYDDEAVVAVRGELDIATAPVLHREIDALWARTINVLTVDLEQLEFMDSSGLRALNDLRVIAEERDVTFALFGVRPAVRRVIDVTGMAELFDMRPIETERSA
jgi:anti-anti-sigma factor